MRVGRDVQAYAEQMQVHQKGGSDMTGSTASSAGASGTGLARRWTEPFPPLPPPLPPHGYEHHGRAVPSGLDAPEAGRGIGAGRGGKWGRKGWVGGPLWALTGARRGARGWRGPSWNVVAWAAVVMLAVVRLYPWLVASTVAACHAADRVTLRHWLADGSHDADVRAALAEVGGVAEGAAPSRLSDEAAKMEGLLDRIAQRKATATDIHAVLAIPCSVALLQEVVRLRRQYANLHGNYSALLASLDEQHARLSSSR